MKKFLMILLVFICFSLNGCGDYIKEEEKNNYELYILKCEEKIYIVGYSNKYLNIDSNFNGEIPTINDGEFAKINADVIVRTGGEKGYDNDLFVYKINDFEIISLEDYLLENEIPEYPAHLAYPEGLEIVQVGKNKYYIQMHKGGYRLYLDSELVEEFYGENVDENMNDYLNELISGK